MLFDEQPGSFKKTIIITALVAVLAGGAGGTAVTLAALATFSGSDSGLAAFGRLLGIPTLDIFGKLSSAAKKQTIVEDSATTVVVERAGPAVVSIVVTRDLSKLYNRTGPIFPFSPFDDFFFGFPFENPSPRSGKQKVGGGTGFIVTTDGMLITNRHVVDQEDAEYTVVAADNKKYPAQVLARDTVNDIAVIKIKADNLPVLDLGDSDKIKIGQTVIAIGNSLGEFSNTVTKGVVSGINRRVTAGDGAGSSEVIEEAIQTDAAINPGNSGGPLLDLFGKAVGVNTAVSREGQLIGFAIPINVVKGVLESVQKHGRIVRAFLGVRYVLLNEDIAKANQIEGIDYGALIVRGESRADLAVVPGSPADKAGIVENDIILEVNGERVTQDSTLTALLNKYKVGDKLKLKMHHRGATKEVEATLVERK